MGTGVMWEDESEVEEGLVVGGLERRMVTEEWLNGEEAMMKERRVAGRESMAFGWGSKNNIGAEFCHILIFSLYLDSAKRHLAENSTAGWFRVRYKCVAQTVKPVPLADGCVPDTKLNWRGRAIAQAVPMPCPWKEWFIPKSSHRARGGRWTHERLRELRIGLIIWPNEMEALLGMPLNRGNVLSQTWEELRTIISEVKSPHGIPWVSGHKVWKDQVFRVPKNVIPIAKELIEQGFRQGLCEPPWGCYLNAHFLVLQQNGNHHFSISDVSAYQYVLDVPEILPNIEEISEAFTGLQISSPIEFHCGYVYKMLHEDSRVCMAFQAMQGRSHPTRLVQGAMHSVSAFARASRKILNAHR